MVAPVSHEINSDKINFQNENTEYDIQNYKSLKKEYVDHKVKLTVILPFA